jgi:hypothetical protein
MYSKNGGKLTSTANSYSVSTRNRTWTWTFGGSNAIRYTIETTLATSRSNTLR